MLTTSFVSKRRSIGSMVAVLLAAVSFRANVAAQTPTVVATSAIAVPNSQVNGAPWQSAVSNRGDFLLFDFKTSGLYQFPSNGAPQITLAAPGVIAGGFTDSGIAVDPRNNNLYLDNNYNGGLIEFPYDAATKTWDLPSVVVASNITGSIGTKPSCATYASNGNYFQGVGLSINDSGIMAVATENGCGVEIFTVPIDLSGNFGPGTPIVANMAKRAKTVAIDNAGNIYYNADAGGFTGVGYIPAGVTGLADETTVTRIDPMLGNVQGVTVDNAGNVYIADGTAGEYYVPLEAGVPNTAHAVLLSVAQANGGPSFDSLHQTLFVPVSSYGGLMNEVSLLIDRVELGSSVVGTAAAANGTVTYAFTATTSPYNFVLSQNGTPGAFVLGDISGCGITLTPPTTDSKGNLVYLFDKNGAQKRTPTPYAAGSTCSLPITFTPQAVGDVSATLSMTDADQNVLNTVVLHGVGLGSSAVIAPDTETVASPALGVPSQVATDASGNFYVADSGQGKVLQFKKGSTGASAPVSIGTGLTAPTGVAVDAAGDVYIADSGNVIKVPFGLVGYDATGQNVTGLNGAGQVTIKSGLGANLKLAVDNTGDVFVGDPDNQQVVRLIPQTGGITEQDYTGFTQLSAIGASGAGDLFVADGANLVEIPSHGSQTTILTTLAGATGLAVDASGSVYVSETGKTLRIPNEAGAYNPADQIALAPDVAVPGSIALDGTGNAYVIDGTAKVVDLVATSGFLNLGTLPTTSSRQAGTATLASSGNVPLNVTAFSSTPDFSETNTNCIGSPIAPGASCTATITFNAGAGDQGPLAGQLTITSDAVTPAAINAVGVGAALAASGTSLTASNLTVTSAPVVINVVSQSGTAPVPTGNVTLTAIVNGTVTNTFVEPLVNGTVTISAAEVQAGSYTFKASYGGDRVYGTSTASIQVTIAPGVVMLAQPAPASLPQYVLSQGTGSSAIYDGSSTPYQYIYLMTLTAVDGKPLIGVPSFDSKGNQIGTNFGSVTLQGSGAGGNCPPVAVNADGTVPFLTSCLPIDTSNNQIPNIETTYTITPIFNSANYGSVTGMPFTLTAVRNPLVEIASDSGTLAVSSGSSATANLTLTSLLGYGLLDANSALDNYSLPVELECANLPPHASCSFSYPTPDPSDANSVAVTPSTPGNVVMTVTSNVPVGTSTSSILRESPVAFAAMFGLSLLGLAFGRKNRLKANLLNGFFLLLLSGMAAGVVACGSGQNNQSAAVLTTPPGSYTVTVTAKQTGSKVVPGNFPGTTQTVSGNGNLVSLPFTVTVNIQ